MVSMDETELKQVISGVLSSPVISLRGIPTGKFNTSYWISTAGGGDFVIRIAPNAQIPMLFYERNMIAQEPVVHQLVRQNTEIPVADVVHFDSGTELLGSAFIIYTALPGLSWYGQSVKDPAALKCQLGQYLRELHENVTAGQFGYVGAHAVMDAQDNWASAFEIMWNKLIDDIASVRMYLSQEADKYKELLGRHIEHFDQPQRASLLHMDIWTQNILTDGQTITGIVDWDRCLWGDPEIELAVVQYCGLLDENFWAGYGSGPTYNRAFQIRHAFYMLYEHQKYIFIRHARNGQTAAARQYLRDCRTLLGGIEAGNYQLI